MVPLMMATTSCSDDDDVVTSVINSPSVTNSDITTTTLTFRWDKVTDAVQYGYTLLDPTGEAVDGGTTVQTAVTFTGLIPATTYTLNVVAYTNVNDPGKTTSAVCSLTATTLAITTLATPQPTATLDGSALTIEWPAIEGAAYYAYTYYTTDDPTSITEGSLEEPKLALEYLAIGEYVFTIQACNDEEIYAASEVATVDVVRSRLLQWSADGRFTLSDGSTIAASISSFDDKTYTIYAWRGVEGYDIEFTVNVSTLKIVNGKDGTSDPALVATGLTGIEEWASVYTATDGSIAHSNFSGTQEYGSLMMYVNGAEETYTWGSKPANESFVTTGTIQLDNYVSLDYVWDVTMSYDAETGIYTLHNWLDDNGGDLEFTVNGDGTLHILSGEEYKTIYMHYVDSGWDDYYYQDDQSYFEGDANGGTFYFTSYYYGPWTFTWSESQPAGWEKTGIIQLDNYVSLDYIWEVTISYDPSTGVYSLLHWLDDDTGGDLQFTVNGDGTLHFLSGEYYSESYIHYVDSGWDDYYGQDSNSSFEGDASGGKLYFTSYYYGTWSFAW